MVRSSVTNRVNLVESPGTVLKTFTDTTGVQITGVGATSEISAERQWNGNNTLKVTTGSGNIAEVALTTAFSQDFNYGTIGWLVYIENPADVPNFVLYEGSVGYASFVTETYGVPSHNFAGWHFIPGTRDLWSAEPINPLGNCKLRITPAAATQAVVHVAEVTVNWRTRPQIMITFDDSLDSQYTLGLPELTSRGFKGTFGIIRGGLDAGEMTTAQAQDLHDNGHSIAVHGATDYGTLGLAAATTEVLAARQFLIDKGWHGAENFVVYPNGVYNTDIIAMLKANNFEAARTTTNSVGAGYGFGFHPYGYDADTRFEMPVIGHQAAHSVANIKLQIDYMINNGATGALMYHGIVASGATGTEVNLADYIEVLEYLRVLELYGLIDVVSYKRHKSTYDNGYGRGIV